MIEVGSSTGKAYKKVMPFYSNQLQVEVTYVAIDSADKLDGIEEMTDVIPFAFTLGDTIPAGSRFVSLHTSSELFEIHLQIFCNI